MKSNLSKVATVCYNCTSTTCLNHGNLFCFNCCDIVIQGTEEARVNHTPQSIPPLQQLVNFQSNVPPTDRAAAGEEEQQTEDFQSMLQLQQEDFQSILPPTDRSAAREEEQQTVDFQSMLQLQQVDFQSILPPTNRAAAREDEQQTLDFQSILPPTDRAGPREEELQSVDFLQKLQSNDSAAAREEELQPQIYSAAARYEQVDVQSMLPPFYSAPMVLEEQQSSQGFQEQSSAETKRCTSFFPRADFNPLSMSQEVVKTRSIQLQYRQDMQASIIILMSVPKCY